MKQLLLIFFSIVAIRNISAQGLTRYGQITTTSSAFVNEKGEESISGLTKNGLRFSVIGSANNNALDFDGTNDNALINSSTSLNITANITLEAWIYPTKNSGIQNVICKSSRGSNNSYIFPRTDNGWQSFVFYLHVNGGWKTVSYPYPALNEWHHLAATYDGSNMKLYLDGTLVKTQAATGTITVNSNSLSIGNQPGYSEYFGGTADELRVWNIARSQADIQSDMYSELAGNETGLVAYYNCNEGTAAGNNTSVTTLTDETSNANNGTLNNFSLTGSTSNWVAGATPLIYDGTSALKASSSAYAIKQAYPSSADGYYWIKNPNINGGNAFQIYADMTTDGGGWTLIMCNANNAGWTYANAISRNTTSPSINSDYSIIGWADYIKKSSSGFQYMIDANTRRSNGAIWTANGAYTFLKGDNSQTDITINTKFGTWTYNDGGIEQIMPWYSNCSGYITTSHDCTGGSWWGTLISQSGWSPAPWIAAGCGTEGCMPNPGIIWYWVR